MDPAQLEQILRDLPNRGTLVKDRGYRQVWRFELNGAGYYLKFYPRGAAWLSRDGWRRRFRGSPARREYERLVWLQKAKVPAPRAIAQLVGFTLDGVKGDAVILRAIEPAVPLDRLLNDQALAGEHPPGLRRRLADQVIELVRRLGAAGFGHTDLHLGNFLLHEGQLYLIDAYELRKGGLLTDHVLTLGASVGRFATTTDIVRGWRALAGADAAVPQANAKAEEVFASQVARAKRGGRYFHAVTRDGWRGLVFRQTNYPRRWSAVSRLELSPADVEALLLPIFAGLKDGTLTPLKQSPSADVYELTVPLAGRDVPVVVKVPHRRYLYRHLTELGRGSRAWRAWVKAWHLVARDLPTAWPIAVLERGVPGYATQSMIVCERVPGPTLWKVDLEALSARGRDTLFHRIGRLLRTLERHGFSHFDAKASNWIVRPDDRLGPGPVLIDVDGIRRRRWPALGVERLLRSLLDRRQYGPEDSLALCRGYAPFARLEQEVGEGASGGEGEGETEESREPTP